MPRSVTLSADDLPDATATAHDDGSIEVSVTGIAGLVASPRALTQEETAAGILAAFPPTVRCADHEQLDLVMLRALEIAMPQGLLENVEGVSGAVDGEQLLLAQIVRVVRRLRLLLDPPQ